MTVPKLRFPEFENAGAWEEKILEKTVSFLKGKGLSKSDIQEDGAYDCIRYGELYTIYNEVINDTVSKTSLMPSDHVLSQKNDVLIPSSGETKIDIAKASALNKDGIILGGDLNILRGSSHGAFLSYYLNGSIRYEIAKLAQGNAVVHLYASQLKQLRVSTPKPSEQKHIADCLSSLDDLISAEETKLDSLKAHKKGLMQNLFPAEGENVPKLRFPEFKDAGAWEKKKLGEVADIIQGFGFPTKYQGTEDARYPFYKVSDISKNIETGNIYMNKAKNYIDDKVLDQIKAKKVPVKSIIFAKIGEALRLNKRAITSIPCIIDNNVAGVKSKEKICEYKFLYYTMLQIDLANYCGGAIPSVNKTTLENITNKYPSHQEQQRIADFLTSLDDLITAQTQKIETLKNHKKGLMQGLFPEVTV